MPSRLPYLRYDELDPGRRSLWDAIAASRGDDLVNADGGLIGPFNAFLHAPGVGRQLTALGHEVRFETSIGRRLSEVAIITVAAWWKAEFEWWAHAPMARRHGVAGAVVDAIGRGEDPVSGEDDERTVHAVARQLTASGHVAPAPTRLRGSSSATPALSSLCRCVAITRWCRSCSTRSPCHCRPGRRRCGAAQAERARPGQL